MQTHYDTLSIDPSATPQQIKHAYLAKVSAGPF